MSSYNRRQRLKEYDIKKNILHEKYLIAYEVYIPLFKRIFLLKKRIIIADYRDEKDNFAMKKFSKMKDFYHFYNNEYQQILKEREKLPKGYIYCNDDLEHFKKTEEYVKRYNEFFPTKIDIKSTVNLEELENNFNIDDNDANNDYEVEQAENKSNINVLYENVFEDFKKNRVNVTNALYSMNRTDSIFTVENITPEKYTEEFFYDFNKDFDMYMNTDADRYYNNYNNYNSYDDDLIEHSQPDYLNDPYAWDKQVYDIYRNDNDY